MQADLPNVIGALLRRHVRVVDPHLVSNVQLYGADPTGGSSSLAAFNNAYNDALTQSPPGIIYAPAGKYLIPNPGLSWTSQSGVRFYGDGRGQTQLVGDASSGYTIMTVSADTGHGTTGVNLDLAKFAILNGGNGQHGLKVADYLGATLQDISIQASGNALTMAGMADYHVGNVNALSWNQNAAGNAGLMLALDTLGIANGPGGFVGSQFEGQSNVTQGGGINSTGTFGTAFLGCLITALGPSLTTIAEFGSGDDITLLNCYSESGCNTTNNNAVMFYLGRAAACLNFSVIGGHYFNGVGGHNCAYGIVEANAGPTTLIGGVWANFLTAAFHANALAGLALLAAGPTAAGGAAKVFDNAGFPSGSTVPFFMYPPITSGFGTPTGAGVINNFPGATATLAQCSEAIAQLIQDYKSLGFYGS